MHDTATKIAAGLEQAFIAHGFAEPNIETLRAAAGVSLRTLYKYTPSRDDMVYAALEHRHQRYLEDLFHELQTTGLSALEEIINRNVRWIEREAPRGCLFHAAVAAAPHNEALRRLLTRHKTEVISKIAAVTELTDWQNELALLMEGLTQSWQLLGAKAAQSALRLGQSFYTDAI